MASAAEQLAANFNFSNLGKAHELRQRIFFTLGALIVARLGTFIPMPGIDPAVLAQQVQQQGGGLLDVFNTFAGGAVERMAIFALSIMPYITSSIIIQVMTTVFPELEALKKEGEAGRKTLNQYTRYGTVFIAMMQAYGIAVGLEHWGHAVINPGLFFRITAMVTLTGGTILLMWIGEQITSRGVGNGASLPTARSCAWRLPRSSWARASAERALVRLSVDPLPARQAIAALSTAIWASNTAVSLSARASSSLRRSAALPVAGCSSRSRLRMPAWDSAAR